MCRESFPSAPKLQQALDRFQIVDPETIQLTSQLKEDQGGSASHVEQKDACKNRNVPCRQARAHARGPKCAHGRSASSTNPNAADGVHEFGRRPVVHFAPNSGDMHIDDVVQRGVPNRLFPNIAGQHFARNNLPAVGQQVFEDLEFSCGEIQHSRPARDSASQQIHLQIGHSQSRGRLRPAPAQQRANTSRKFWEREWLHQIIVSPGIKSENAIFDAIFRGQQQHRDAYSLPAHRGEHLDSATPGEHDVQHGKIEWLGADSKETFLSGVGERNGIGFCFEPFLQSPGDLLPVFHHEYSQRSASLRSPGRREEIRVGSLARAG